MQSIATLIALVFIVGLFLLDRDKTAQPSKWLFVPLFWLLIAASRNVSEWVQMGAPGDGGDAYVEGSPLDRNFLGALIILGVIALYQRRQKLGAVLKANLPIVLFFAYCLISVIWSDYSFVAFKRWFRGIGDVVMVLVVLTDGYWPTARQRVLAWAGFVVLPMSVLFIRYYPDLGRIYGVHDGKFYWTGVGTSKNELGLICMVFGIAFASHFLDFYRAKDALNRRRHLIVHGAMLLMALWLVRMADSATSFACLLLGVIAMVMASSRKFTKKPVLINLFVAAVLFVPFAALFLSSNSDLVGALGRDSTLTGRSDVWRNVLTLVQNPVVGTGYESFWIGPRLEMMTYLLQEPLNQAHNGYLEIYINLGWVGIILLAAVIIAGYRNILRSMRLGSESARLRLAYFVAALAFNFTEAGFKMRHPVWICFLMAAFAVPDDSPAAGEATDTADRFEYVPEPIAAQSAY